MKVRFWLVVNAEKWFAQTERKGLRGFQADEQRARQAGALGGGDGVEVGGREAGLAEDFARDGQEVAEMFAGGKFGNDAAVFGVHGGLGGNDVGEDGAVADDRGAGFVARGFEGEEVQGLGFGVDLGSSSPRPLSSKEKENVRCILTACPNWDRRGMGAAEVL